MRGVLHPIDTATTAVITMEMEKGVIGSLATMPEMAAEADRLDLAANVGAFLQTARLNKVQVVHAIAEWRQDRKGTTLNTPLLGYLSRFPQQILTGTEAVELVDGLGPEPEDLLSRRYGGLTPFTGTNLDSLLRSCGISTIIAVGASLNVGVTGLVFEAVSLGYSVIVPADGVVAVPPEYGEWVLAHSIKPLAEVTTLAEVSAAIRG